MAGVEDTMDKCVKCVEGTYGACKCQKQSYTNCAARYAENEGGRVQLDQDEYIKELRSMQHPELTGTVA
eukprot:9503839-Pyramimonas_sp.AAC.5